MGAVRLAGKVFQAPEVAFRPRQLERFERPRKARGPTAAQARLPGNEAAARKTVEKIVRRL